MIPSPARDWLPLGAFEHSALRRKVEHAIAAWSSAWLPRRTLSVVSWAACAEDRRDDTDGAGWRKASDGLAVSLAGRARGRLLGWALDTHLDEPALSEADRHVLEGFSGAMIEDLLTRLRTAWAPSAARSSGLATVANPLQEGGVVAGVGEAAGGALLSLALPASMLLPAVRTVLAPPRRPAGVLAPRRRALADLPVRLRARLGGADLPLGDVRSLAVGDVLVLDRAIADGAELVVAADGVRVGQGALSDIDGATALTFQRS